MINFGERESFFWSISSIYGGPNEARNYREVEMKKAQSVISALGFKFSPSAFAERKVAKPTGFIPAI